MTCNATYNQGALDINLDLLFEIYTLIRQLHAQIPIDFLHFNKLVTTWEFKIKFMDTRIWKQSVTFDQMLDPLLGYTQINDLFRLSEVAPYIRDLRVAFINLHSLLVIDTFEVNIY